MWTTGLTHPPSGFSNRGRCCHRVLSRPASSRLAMCEVLQELRAIDECPATFADVTALDSWARVVLYVSLQTIFAPSFITELPHKSTLNQRITTTPKIWLESTNQLGLRPQWRQFEEGSSLITPRQLSVTNARVLLFLDAYKGLQRHDKKQIHSSINVLLLSKKKS